MITSPDQRYMASLKEGLDVTQPPFTVGSYSAPINFRVAAWGRQLWRVLHAILHHSSFGLQLSANDRKRELASALQYTAFLGCGRRMSPHDSFIVSHKEGAIMLVL